MIEVEQGSIPLNRAVGLYKTPIKLDLAWPVVVVESQGMKTPFDRGLLAAASLFSGPFFGDSR